MSSESSATGTGAGTGAAAANSSANNNKKQKMFTPLDSLLFADDLVWSGQILSFVGVGQYAFVGAVNKKMNQLYKEYCKIELKKNPREVNDNPEAHTYVEEDRSAESTDTLYSETFCNLLRAEYWLKDNSSNKKPDRDLVCTAIAKIGNIAVMQWARQKGFPWNEDTCARAAENGHLEMLQWLREKGCPWNEYACLSAAANGHLEILKWLHANGCTWDESTCTAAAENGHLEILKWAHENGCPWDEGTCQVAAADGQLEILKWARENGCPWNEETCFCAAQNGHLEFGSGLVQMVVHVMNKAVPMRLLKMDIWKF
ncbi:ankyrin repeat protein [Seminavis robusta]|uniref:Ankyrin repeat protein n=1 Tax=Seminavis robusta TaxID=568900 RepID=A0A9N8D5V4_9STRA|nr:ankyrin repeat protein [Seminavis robusta]|eukprot:Sro8_g006430.1 ankyrin repeat protein (315) ;mRNA; f:4802-5746